MVDHGHGFFGESSPEPGEGRMIGSSVIKRKPKVYSEGDSIVDLCFQLRDGIDFEPLLEKNTLYEKYW